MGEDFLSKLNRLEKQYRQYRSEADRIHIRKHGTATEEEVNLRVMAAKTAKEIAENTDSEIKEKYLGIVQQQKSLINELLTDLERMEKDNIQEAKGSTAPLKAAAAAGTSRADGDAIEADPGWYRERPKHGLDDVTGMDQIKSRLGKSLVRMKRSELLKLLDMDGVSGFLFYGPPGCGKTFLTEAFVNELMGEDFKYLSLDAKDIHSKYSGEAEKITGAVFAEAEKAAPSLLFFDEMDAVCTERQQPELPQHTRALTDAFLTSYNHLNASGKKVYLVGATNFPQNVDTAMISRMELVRIPLPDAAARAGFFEQACKKVRLNLGEGLTAEHMASRTKNYSYRDLNGIMNFIKGEIFDSLDYLDIEEAKRELEEGRCVITKELFEYAYKTILPTFDRKYMNALAEWERDHGIEPIPLEGEETVAKPGNSGGTEDKKKLKPGSAVPTDGKMDVSKDTMVSDEGGKISEEDSRHGSVQKALQKLEERYTPAWVADRKNCMPLQETKGTIPEWSYGFPSGINNHPCLDSLYAFLCSKAFFSNIPDHIGECANRFQECGEGFRSEASAYRETGFLTPEAFQELCTLGRLMKQEAAVQTDFGENGFEGFRGTDFLSAYDGFNTGYQGNVDPEYAGICGIVASCNLVNQQLGSRLTEKDGIQTFVENDWCVTEGEPCEKGGTSWADRQAFMEMYGLTVENCIGSLHLEENTGRKELQLEEICQRLKNGYSAQIALIAEDLTKPGIFAGRYKKSLFGFGPRELIADLCCANHAVTVAGISTEKNGRINGMWLNDTGGWSTGSNRVFIDTKKWSDMLGSTAWITVTYSKKKEEMEG